MTHIQLPVDLERHPGLTIIRLCDAGPFVHIVDVACLQLHEIIQTTPAIAIVSAEVNVTAYLITHI